jgi:hypothetical protein
MARMALTSSFSASGKTLPTVYSFSRLKTEAASKKPFGYVRRRWFKYPYMVLWTLLLVAWPAWGSIASDVNASTDLPAAATQISSPSFSTSSGNELLLALIATDSQSSPMTVTSVAGGGLTWIPVARANTTGGTAEIWRAFAVAPVSNVIVTAYLPQKIFASIQILSFSGVDASGSNGSGAIGAVATAGSVGAPSASLTTTRANSLVLGVGNDFDTATARTLPSGQTLLHQDLSAANHDTYWMQRLTTAVSASGTKVTINDTAPKTDHFNLAICEILAPAGATAPSISSLSASSGAAGASVMISGSNFGASQDNGNVTFNGTAATVTNWTGNSITAIVPYGATTGKIVVAAGNGLPSNGVAFTVAASAGGLGIDASVVADLPAAGTQLSTSSFSTSASNELLLALIATDAKSAGMNVSAVSGGGLTWVLVKRANVQLGDAEIWRAFAPSPLSNVSVTATLSQSVVASMQVLSFTGADASGSNGSGAIGAVASGNANPGVPTASLVTTRANSWVVGVGNDYDRSISRTVGPGQTLTNQYWSPTNDTYWMQRQNNTTPASGTTVTINDTAPSSDRYNLAIVEILPGNAAPPVINSLSPTAGQVGDVVTINGSNFGTSPGSNAVTFGGTPATTTPISSSQIQVAVPSGTSLGAVPVVVTTAPGASNSATFTVVAPLAVAAFASPAPNAAGWNNTNVTITYTCTGGVAPVVCPATKTVTTEGANQIISATAMDAVGNQATVSVTLNVDKTAPIITAAVTPAPTGNAVVTAPATITFTCTDSLSGIVSCPAPITVNTPGANQSFSGSATDRAGNVAKVTVTLNVEAGQLAVTATATPAPNDAGWNNTNVTVTYACTGGVPPVQCPAPQTVSTEGANQTTNATATDSAGNTASTSVILNIDKTAPTISTQTLPLPDANGISTFPVTVSFTCSDALSGVFQCPPPVIVNQGGSQTVHGQVLDNAGNVASTSVSLNVQSAPLSIAVTASPAANAAGWNNSDVTVSALCSGGVPRVNCPAPRIITTEGAHQAIVVTATDAGGNNATGSVTLNIDKTPPSLNITLPADGSTVSSAQTNIQGLVADALSGPARVTCNGVAAVLTGTAFNCNVSLLLGSNPVVVTAFDVAGNSASSTISLIYANPINLQITSPTSLQLFSANPITVTGTVDRPGAVVTVGGVTASVSQGSFTAANVILREGKSLLTATATSADGGLGSETVTVFLDTTPPVVHIDNLAEGSILTSGETDVTGNVNDLVTGTVNGDQVGVVVNGVTADVRNRSFAAHHILLVPGSNTITAIATDRAGNSSQHQVHVVFQSSANRQSLSVVSGNNQSAPILTLLPAPLVVQASDALGRPLPGVSLTFAVSRSDGSIVSGQNQGRSLTVRTNGNGNASVQFRLGSRAGVGVNQVAVSAPGFVGQAMFSADSAVGAASQIHTVSGEAQTGMVGVPLAEPLVAIVTDVGGNPVPGVPVTFTVRSGGGLVGGQITSLQTTDSDGKASVVLLAGQQEGINNNVVTADFSGLQGQPAAFTASGVVPGLIQNTTITGTVLDDANQPIVNATASVKGTNLSAVTNSSGRFTIKQASVGNIILFIDGSTSTDSDTYPTLSFQMATIPGIENSLPGPIYLPAIDTANSQVVGGDQDVVLTMKDVPGVAYKVFANSVTFPDGTHVGRLTLSQVHSDKVPMTPPNGTAPRLVGTLQPAGVKFDPPIQMTLPNTDGLAPGQVEEIFSFHHDVEQFVVEGTGRVSEDGSIVVSDPGFGLTVSGWHGGGGNPPQGLCGDACNSCQKCFIAFCISNSDANGQPCQADECTANGKCTDGDCKGDPKQVTSVVLNATDPDVPNSVPQSPLLKVAGVNEQTYPVQFNAQAESQHCDDIQYDWDFGDGDSEQNLGSTPVHNYGTAGTFTVRVTVHCGQCQTPDGKKIANMLVGVATIEEVDVTIHATPNPNGLGPAYQDDPPYIAALDPNNPSPPLVLPLGIAPVDMECITTPDHDDPVFGAQIQAMTKWFAPQDGSVDLQADGSFATVDFNSSGKPQMACYLDANGTGQVAQNDAIMPVNAQIASIDINSVDTEVHSNQIKQNQACIAGGDVCITSGTFDLNNLANNVFNLRIDLSVNDIDAAQIPQIDVVYAQNLHNMNVAGVYNNPGHNATFLSGPPVGQVLGAVTLVCPGGINFVPFNAPYNLLDSGQGVNGGATPSTTTGNFDPQAVANRNGQQRRLTWVDAPGNFHFEGVQPCDHNNTLTATTGGFAFSTYLVAYSMQAPHSYAVIGRADWSMTWSGTVTPALVWTRTGKAQSTGLTQNGYPLSGADTGIEVNPPVSLQFVKKDGR